MENNQRRLTLSIGLVVIALLGGLIVLLHHQAEDTTTFSETRAWKHLKAQLALGPRTPGSKAHAQVIEYISRQLEKSGWEVEIQESESMGHIIKNIVAKRGTSGPWVIFGAHYDSRLFADQDENGSNQSEPVPGANDGASGVAVLLEMARVIPADSDQQVWLVFFDAEDQGHIEGWEWILGSRCFVDTLTAKPDAVVIIDMIGDSDLNIYREKSSDPGLTDDIWQTAETLGYSGQFINEDKYSILDDHLPFLEAGIPAIDIIDFDYPYWHTLKDTREKVSPESLSIVGNTLLTWLSNQTAAK